MTLIRTIRNESKKDLAPKIALLRVYQSNTSPQTAARPSLQAKCLTFGKERAFVNTLAIMFSVV